MQRIPNSYAISSALKSYTRLEYKLGCVSIHGKVQVYEFSSCVYVQTAILDLYSKVGDAETARKVFDEMSQRFLVSWNSIVYVYAQRSMTMRLVRRSSCACASALSENGCSVSVESDENKVPFKQNILEFYGLND
ncbi:hypothetical protein K1719_018817 [Acacia pycnantha]|nr:hypothetical protein K1719_018817 [Acacia pycnantha]